MSTASPRTLAELLSAGAFIQAGIDSDFRASLGEIHGVEFNFLSAGAEQSPTEPTGPAEPASASADGNGLEVNQLVEVRVHTPRGARDFRGVRLAVIEDETWHWATSATNVYDIPELKEPQPYSEYLVQAARCIVGGLPIFIAEQDGDASTASPMSARRAAIAIVYEAGALPPRDCIMAGIEAYSGLIDERAALLGLAEKLQLTVQINGDYMQLFDGTTARFSPMDSIDGSRLISLNGSAWGLSPYHVLADSHYMAVEQQLFINGRYPGLQAQLDLDRGKAWLSNQDLGFEADAFVIATTTAQEFTWAWADRNLEGSPAAAASHNLHRFGADQAIPDLVRPRLPLSWAKQAALPHLAMPILGVFSLTSVALDAETTALVLVSAPELSLPEPSEAAIAATLAVAVPQGVDEKRARASYARLRGIELPQLP